MGAVELLMLGAWHGVSPHLWKRFIDDIMFFWRGTETELENFISFLNLQHPTIKFEVSVGESYNFDTKSINFLDLTIWIDSEGFIQTTLYTKPCRVVNYLLPSSSHPHHITKNIPFSLSYRLKRIESLPENFAKNLEVLRSELISRQYKPKVIDRAFDRVQDLDRIATIQKVPRPENTRVVLCLPFDRRLPDVTGMIRHRYKCLVERDPNSLEYLPEPPMLAFSRTNNIRDMLVRAKVPGNARPVRHTRQGFKKCGKRINCPLCPFSSNRQSFQCKFTGVNIQIKQHISCQDYGIYILFCDKENGECGKVCPLYIGECGPNSSFKDRFGQHMATVTEQCHSDTVKPVGRHFRLPGHKPSNMCMLPIEKVIAKDPFIRKARESFYIKLFRTLKFKSVYQIEHGLNLDKGQI